jgi:transposase-like protein
VRGRRGRGAIGKTPVLGVLKRNDKVFGCQKLLERRVASYYQMSDTGRGGYSDGWKAYDGLIINGYDHYRVFHSNDEFARGKCHGTEAFWTQRRLAEFNGVHSSKFILYIQECEFRYNNKNQNLMKIMAENVLQNLKWARAKLKYCIARAKLKGAYQISSSS